jgi:hypothetical protein
MGYLADHILDRAPKFLRRLNLGRYLSTVGLMNDQIVLAATLGLRQSNPLTCDVCSFPALSKDRNVPLNPMMPEAAQRFALSRWRQRARSLGTEYLTLLDLQTYFYTGPGALLPRCYSVHQTGDGGSSVWRTLGAAVGGPLGQPIGGVYSENTFAPSNFDYDSHTRAHAEGYWSRCWYFIDMTGTSYTGPYTYGDGDTYGDGIRYGEGGANPFTGPQQADLIQIAINDCAPHSWVGALIFIWGAGFNYAGTPAQDVTGWWSLPSGHWGLTYDPTTGLGTRPPYLEWVYDNPAPVTL